MAGPTGTMTLRTIERIGEVDPADWDACAGAANPFVAHAFLKALEDSGSVGGRTGWRPEHVVLDDATGAVVACAPLYLKGHSQGEYVFDHGWAEAYERAGGRYYPKLQLSVPFTPVPGPRLLVRPDQPGETRAALAGGLIEVARRHGVSSLHATFCAPADIEALRAAGCLVRTGFQYHWDNRGYATFEDFLAALSHGKRKSIRKERREVAAQGVEMTVLSGDALKPEHWDAFFDFYIATSDRKWGSPYLTREFFDRLQATMADRVAFVMARHDGRWVAGALNLIGADTLYGRNWGCAEDFKHLHFECCYYQGIEYCIEQGLQRFEPGAQGEHKLARGFLPQLTHSSHYLPMPAFREAVAESLIQERRWLLQYRDELLSHSPYRSESSPG